MIGKNMAEVFGYVPKDIKARVERIKETSRISVSKVVLMGLERVLPELEQTLGLNRPKGSPHGSLPSPPKQRRRKGKSSLYSASQWSFPSLNNEGKSE